MTEAAPAAPTTIVGRSDVGAHLDILVHALAQLPDTPILELEAVAAQREELTVLAEAYGVADRVAFGGSRDGIAVDPRRHTLAELIAALDPEAAGAPTTRGDDEVLRGHHVVVVTNIPAHYRIPLFDRVAARLDRVDGRLTVVFTAPEAAERVWMAGASPSFEHRVLRSRTVRAGEREKSVPVNLERVLRRLDPTVVVAGGFSPVVAGRAALLCSLRRIPFGVWSGEIASTRTAASRVRRAQRAALLRLADFGVAYGSAAREYLRSLAPHLPTVIARNTSVEVVSEARMEHGQDARFVLVSHLVPRKGVDLVVAALRATPETKCRLTIVGDGPMRRELEAAAAGDARIRFTGAFRPPDVRRAYDEADVLLFATREDIFGLVVPEAMAAGLAVATSVAAGAVHDLCVDRTNSIVVREPTRTAWGEAIGRLADDRELRSRLGDAARATIAARWTIAHSADAMIAGFRLGALRRRSAQSRRLPRRAGWRSARR